MYTSCTVCLKRLGLCFEFASEDAWLKEVGESERGTAHGEYRDRASAVVELADGRRVHLHLFRQGDEHKQLLAVVMEAGFVT